jgi:hypothetical protein
MNWAEIFSVALPVVGTVGSGVAAMAAFYWKLREQQSRDRMDALESMAGYAETLEERIHVMYEEHRAQIAEIRTEFNQRESVLLQRVAVLEAEIGRNADKLLGEVTRRIAAEQKIEFHQREIARLANENLVLRTEIKELTRG